MKVLLIDVSVNASIEQVRNFVKSYTDADYFIIFDYEYGIYHSYEELIAELNSYEDDYFTHPCALRDILTTLLSKLRRLYKPIDVYLCSENIDDCSIYSTSESFINFLNHIEDTTQIKLHGFNSESDSDYAMIKNYSSISSSFIDKFLSKFAIFNTNDDYSDDDLYI